MVFHQAVPPAPISALFSLDIFFKKSIKKNMQLRITPTAMLLTVLVLNLRKGLGVLPADKSLEITLRDLPTTGGLFVLRVEKQRRNSLFLRPQN
ncbi:MAG: hypothetical protein A3B28_00560 [Candidatus Wildermuthbacteria bacterium RIFCSPLOWO2_01_FULL_50_46]|nr:MAG: hypothetical protein A2674_00725 [Candidatus Wildermuthbacteria bacterium RIFCSPHIGHO2_01_FULL_50_47]OHA72199.1 MAG: hypothetical protein A3E08_03065 [Candidatus Wildermuthbacteria bacterium RIFCSPHIGHO2_12_FULL_49_13]OHA74717.1 MAG: hypothetical protein A3B28_00560 [Candidatus Wildermuthbacteria bacterium RIFCSPLOWO2_01_FULL_50_46]OHA78079.1 MAG: hypothetical protein A2564_00375 [Candidatus Wildermuthbacteria bacterium RIFOXYD1_FULL_50_12]